MKVATAAVPQHPEASEPRTARANDDANTGSFGDHLATQRARKAKKADDNAPEAPPLPPPPPSAPTAADAKPAALVPISQTSPASALIAASFGRALAAIVSSATPSQVAAVPAADPQAALQPIDDAPAPQAPAKAEAPSAGDVEPAPTDIAAIAQAAIAQSDAQPTAPALTPLEQALHDLLEQLHDRREQPAHEGSEAPTPHATTASPTPHAAVAVDAAPARDVRATPAVAPAAAVREMRELPEPNANPSHLHLVLGDDSDRVVVTVAVRGNDVNVAVRGNDELTAASLARNAGVLEHAMRARGLDLSSFSAERDHDHSKRNRDSDREPERRDDQNEPFRLEELP